MTDNSVLDTILASAVRTGSNVIKDIVSAQLGQTIGGLAGTVVDTIAESLGVPPADIPYSHPKDLDVAVAIADDNAEILKLYLEQQRLSNDLMLAEMGKNEALWTWAWRPAWMWFLMLIWFCALLLFPFVRGMTGANIETPDLGVVGNLTMLFLALYMGGHTAKSIWGKSNG